MNLAAPIEGPPVAPYIVEADGELALHFEESQIQSKVDRADPDRLVLPYTRAMFGFRLFCPAPARVLLIGLGGGAMARHCRKILPDTDLTAVEASTEVLALRERLFVPPDDAHFHVIQGDGAEVVRSGAPYDVILVDGFDAGGQAPSLCTPGFYADCRGRLVDGGVLAVNINALTSGNGRYVRRIRDAFDGRLVVVPTPDELNRIVFAWRGEVTIGADVDPELEGLAGANRGE